MAGGGEPPVREGLSRAALSPQPLEIVRQIARDLRDAAVMSRAAFARQAADIIEERLAFLAEPAGDGADVTRRLTRAVQGDLAAITGSPG